METHTRADSTELEATPRGRTSRLFIGFWASALAAMVLLRTLWLNSDAYPRLSWSSGLMTDEGFYLHNARNVTLFGHLRTDDFNNMLIMPLLHLLQVGVFRVCGVSLVASRGISVACSLLTLILFYLALHRRWGGRVAGWGLLLLGLDHTNLLYNRLGLMDTPATLLLVAGFAAFVRALSPRDAQTSAHAISGVRPLQSGDTWMFLCGAALGIAYTIRGLAALAWIAPLVALVRWQSLLENVIERWRRRLRTADARRYGRLRDPSATGIRQAIPYVTGLLFVLGVYLWVWWLPHLSELSRMNAHYMKEQLVPHTPHELLQNVTVSMVGWQRGIVPYLLRHTPVQVVLVFMLAGSATLRLVQQERRDMDPATVYLAVWLVVNVVFNCGVNYAPSRYYVLFYPALSALSAISIDRCAWPTRVGAKVGVRPGWIAVIAIWAAVNGFWLVDWMSHLSYRQRNICAWLARHLPDDSVLFGAFAPGLSVDTRFRSVSVIENLCNDNHPVERYSQSPGYILILDDRWKEQWWVRNYPSLVAPDRRMTVFRGVLRPFFTIGVYPVPERPVVRSGKASTLVKRSNRRD